MLRRFCMLASLFSALIGLSSCQFFVDGRNESLLVVSAADWAELHQFKEEQRQAKLEANKPQALPGSETISFSNVSDAYLAGCRTLGIVEVHHYGSYDEALILMRNQAHQLAASVIVPLDIYQDQTCLLYTSPSPRDGLLSRMPSSA